MAEVATLHTGYITPVNYASLTYSWRVTDVIGAEAVSVAEGEKFESRYRVNLRSNCSKQGFHIFEIGYGQAARWMMRIGICTEVEGQSYGGRSASEPLGRVCPPRNLPERHV